METNGVWGRVLTVPGITEIEKKGPAAEVDAVSCAAPGNCSAGGSYSDSKVDQDGHFGGQAFLLQEKNGKWGRAREVPGTGPLDVGDAAGLDTMSCFSPGNCTAGGGYTDGNGYNQPFVVDEVHGVWERAKEVPGIGSLSATGEETVLQDLSCASPGNCAAGGYLSRCKGSCYNDFVDQAWVATEVKGDWQQAILVPGTQKLNSGGNASVNAT